MTTIAPLAISLFIAGRPAPQGSKRGMHHKQSGKIILLESSKRVAPWRQDVRQAFTGPDGRALIVFPPGWPILVIAEFVMPRLASFPKTRPTPPHTKKPDLDKLIRAVLDAIGSAGVWTDDSQVNRVQGLSKRYAERDEPSGCHIVLRSEGPS